LSISEEDKQKAIFVAEGGQKLKPTSKYLISYILFRGIKEIFFLDNFVIYK